MRLKMLWSSTLSLSVIHEEAMVTVNQRPENIFSTGRKKSKTARSSRVENASHAAGSEIGDFSFRTCLFLNWHQLIILD
jgi:hypothetical protein